MNILKGIGIFAAAIVVLLVLLGIGTGFEILGIQKDRITEPMRENVKRDVFENTNSYNRGVANDLARYRKQYLMADQEDKEAIASTIALQFGDYDADKLQSNELASFLIQIRGY